MTLLEIISGGAIIGALGYAQLKYLNARPHCPYNEHDWKIEEGPMYIDAWARKPQQNVSWTCRKCGKHKSFKKF